MFAANRAHSIIRLFFNWAVENDLLAASPVAGVRGPHSEQSRDRVLTDDELRAVWQAADKSGYPFGPIVQMLILTGQRRSEVAEMTRSEIVGDTWTLPRERVKNGRHHEVPLSRQAHTLLRALPHIGDEYVFTVSGSTPYTGFHKGKAQLGKRLAGTRQPAGSWRRKTKPSAVRARQEGSHRSCKPTPSAVPGGAGKRADGRCPHRPPAVWEAALSPVGAAPISAHCRPGVRRRQRPR